MGGSLIGFINNNKTLFLVAALALVLCGFSIFGHPIYILDEAKNSEAAREMLESGNYIVPTFNGTLRTDKPPLHYFFMMIGYSLFGVNPMGARFFSAIFGMLTIVSTYLFVKKFKGKQTAVITAMVLLSSFYFIQEFHLSVPDPYLIFFISFALFCFYSYTETNKLYYILLFYLSIGLGVLSKGPVAIVLPGIIALIYLIFIKRFSFAYIWKLQPLLGIIIVLGVSAPWFYLVDKETGGEWTKGFFLDHNLNRFSAEKEGHGGLFIITLLFVFLGMLPFSITIIQAFKNVYRKRKEDTLLTFSAIVALVTVIFFSVSSTKLPNYPMPCYPFLAVVFTLYLTNLYTEKKQKAIKALKISTIVLLSISALLPIGAWIALATQPALEDLKWHSLWLCLLPIGTFIAYRFLREELYRKAFVTATITWGSLTIVLFGFIYPDLLQKNPVTAFQNTLKGNEEMVVYQRMDSAFPINFKRTFPVLNTPEELTNYLEKHPRKVYIISNSNDAIKELETMETLELSFKQRALFENHTTNIFIPKNFQ